MDGGDKWARRKSHLLVSEADRPKTISHDILGFRKYCKDVRAYVHPCHEFRTYVCCCVCLFAAHGRHRVGMFGHRFWAGLQGVSLWDAALGWF